MIPILVEAVDKKYSTENNNSTGIFNMNENHFITSTGMMFENKKKQLTWIDSDADEISVLANFVTTQL